jgi:hypothetical protein
VVGEIGRWMEFRNGAKRGIPPIFSKECASGCESAGCENMENRSVQELEKKEVAKGLSKRFVRKGAVTSRTSIAGAEVRVNND